MDQHRDLRTGQNLVRGFLDHRGIFLWVRNPTGSKPRYASGVAAGAANNPVMRAPTACASLTAESAAARDNGEPSVGTRMCLYMAIPRYPAYGSTQISMPRI